MKKILLISLFCFSAAYGFSQMTWQSRPSFPGPSRHHAIGFGHGSKGYVLTGEDTTQFKDVWEYDTLLNMWSQLPDYPGPNRSYGIGAVVNDIAYIGFGYSDTTFLTDWWAYDFNTTLWIQKNDFPGAGRNHPTCAALNGKIYMGFGDNTTGSINDWWEYDPSNDSWIQKTNYPGTSMHHPVTAASSSLIYLSEGHIVDSTSNYGSAKVYSYDGSNDTWTTLADMPGPGVVAGASFYLGGNKIYSGAGITEPIETFHKEFYEYDITSNTWDTIADYAGYGVFGPVSFNIGNTGYVATGFGNSVTTQEFYMLAPILSSDAGLVAIATINGGPSCNTTFSPLVTLLNYGSTPLTSCTINYQIDGGTLQIFPWTGTLNSMNSVQITLPVQTVTPGSHIFTCNQTDPNGTTDLNTWNDQSSQEFLIFSSTTVATPIIEGFDSLTFPPNLWQRFNPDGAVTWENITSVGGFGNSTSAVWLNCYDYSVDGEKDFLYTPPMNFTTFLSPTYVTFSVAYTGYDSLYCDDLDIDISTDCGTTWTNAYSKSCHVLQTDTATTSPFVPDSSQWRTDSINLDTFLGQGNVILRFNSTNHFGNNLFLDDVNFYTNNVGVNSIMDNANYSIYPNPSNHTLLFSETLNNIQIFNLLGESIFTEIQSANSLVISSLADGIYFIKSDEGIRRFIVKH